MQRECTHSRSVQHSAHNNMTLPARQLSLTDIEYVVCSLALFKQGLAPDLALSPLPCRFGVLNGTEINPDFAQGECSADRPLKLRVARPIACRQHWGSAACLTLQCNSGNVGCNLCTAALSLTLLCCAVLFRAACRGSCHQGQ